MTSGRQKRCEPICLLSRWMMGKPRTNGLDPVCSLWVSLKPLLGWCFGKRYDLKLVGSAVLYGKVSRRPHPNLQQDIFFILDQDRLGKVTMREFFSAARREKPKQKLPKALPQSLPLQAFALQWRVPPCMNTYDIYIYIYIYTDICKWSPLPTTRTPFKNIVNIDTNTASLRIQFWICFYRLETQLQNPKTKNQKTQDRKLFTSTESCKKMGRKLFTSTESCKKLDFWVFGFSHSGSLDLWIFGRRDLYFRVP